MGLWRLHGLSRAANSLLPGPGLGSDLGLFDQMLRLGSQFRQPLDRTDAIRAGRQHEQRENIESKSKSYADSPVVRYCIHAGSMNSIIVNKATFIILIIKIIGRRLAIPSSFTHNRMTMSSS